MDESGLGGRRSRDDSRPTWRQISVGYQVVGDEKLTSLAEIRLRGSYIRHLESRSSASELAAVKTSRRGVRGKLPIGT